MILKLITSMQLVNSYSVKEQVVINSKKNDEIKIYEHIPLFIYRCYRREPDLFSIFIYNSLGGN